MSNMTKKAIVSSLKECLQETPIDKITITEIVNRCGVNRMTFYYHFNSIYDCFLWGARQEVEEALEHCRSYSTLDEGLLEIFRAAQENKTYVINVFHSLNHEETARHLYSVIEELLSRLLDERAAGLALSEKDREFIIDFYKVSFAGIILKWISSNMEEDPEFLLEHFRIMRQNSMDSAIRLLSTLRK